MADPTHDRAGTASRRAVLFGAGALGAAGLVAGCGGGGSPPATDRAGQATGGQAASTGPIAEAEIPVGSGKIFPEARVVVTQPAAGSFRAFDATCTHQGCLVASVEGDTIICPCHNSHFSIADGSVKQGPAQHPLNPKPVTAAGGSLTVS